MARSPSSRSVVHGKDYEMPSAFGSVPIAPLLATLVKALPVGSSLQLITPIAHELKRFLRQGEKPKRSGFFKARAWTIYHTGPDGLLSTLAELAEQHLWNRTAVWFTAVGPDGLELLEAEDGNVVLFVADAMPPESLAAILDVTGVKSHGSGSAALGSVFP